MRKYALAFLLGLMLLTGALLFPGPTAIAATTSNNAIRVSPAISTLQLQQAQANATITATVTNLTPSPLSVALSAKDFGALNETGTVSFYGSSYNPATNPHSLQSAIGFSSPTITLAPHESQKVAVTLDNLDSLAAGGHFGAALFTPESPLASQGKSRISVRSSVASLIFLTTASGGTESLQLLSFHVSALSFSLPVTQYIGFHNSGNTQSIVRGQLTLYGPNGNIVSTTVLNPGSGLVLPGTSRVFPVTLPLANKMFARPGIYRLRLQYRGDTQSTFTTINERFYYINLVIFIPLVLLIIAIIYLAKWHGRKVLKVGKYVARQSAHRIKQVGRKKPAPVIEKPKRKHPRIQG